MTSVICRKRDCKSLKFLAISKGEIKMTVINKVPAKPTIEAVLRLATSEVINLLSISIDSFRVTRSVFVYSAADRSLFADAIGTNRKLMSCSFLLERKNNGEAL